MFKFKSKDEGAQKAAAQHDENIINQALQDLKELIGERGFVSNKNIPRMKKLV